MGNEDKKSLKQNVASMSCDSGKEIEMHGGAGEIPCSQWRIGEPNAKTILIDILKLQTLFWDHLIRT